MWTCPPSRADLLQIGFRNLHRANNHRGQPVEAELRRSGGREIDNAAAFERAAIVNADINDAAVVSVGDFDGAAEWQAAMCRRERARISPLTTRRFAAAVGIDGGYPSFRASHSHQRAIPRTGSDTRSCDHPQSPANVK